MQIHLNRQQANLILLLTACAWGCAFVPQNLAAPFIGPLSFTAAKFLLAALVISPLVWLECRNITLPRPTDWLKIIAMGGLLAAGSALQQKGVASTSVTNAGFLSGLYVPLVPLCGWLLYRRRAHWVVWPAAAGCVIGTWMLTGGSAVSFSRGDLWILASVIPFTLHVLWIGGLAERVGAPLLIAWGQFIVCGVLALFFALLFERFDTRNISHIAWPIAYMGLISVGVGFTGQVIAQRFARPAEAAIILSSESVFAALAGALFIGERLNLIGYLGCGLIFLGIVLVQILPADQPPLIEQH